MSYIDSMLKIKMFYLYPKYFSNNLLVVKAKIHYTYTGH